MKKTFIAMVLSLLMIATVQAAEIDFVSPLAGVDGDTSGWSVDDTTADLGTNQWSLLGGTANVNAFSDGTDGILTHKGIRGIGIKGGTGFLLGLLPLSWAILVNSHRTIHKIFFPEDRI